MELRRRLCRCWWIRIDFRGLSGGRRNRVDCFPCSGDAGGPWLLAGSRDSRLHATVSQFLEERCNGGWPVVHCSNVEPTQAVSARFAVNVSRINDESKLIATPLARVTMTRLAEAVYGISRIIHVGGRVQTQTVD